MANVVRLVNGGSIQVRTGVLQGIGPAGPRGVAGPQGVDGPAGPIGEQGPIGQILQQSSLTNVGTTNAIPINTDTLITFGQVSYDLAGVMITSTNVVLPQAGDYLFCCWLRFDDAAASIREVWFTAGGATFARASRMSSAGSAFYVDLSFPYHAAGGETCNVYVRAGAATNVSLGVLTVTRVGSGPQGIQGPPGVQGVQGIAGPKGDAGPPGTANSGFAHYSDMLPH